MWAKVAFDNEGVAESWTRLVRATADGFGDAWRPESEGWKSKPVAKTTHVVWTEETDRRLIELVEKQGLGNWRRKNTLLRFASEAPTPELVERRWQKLFRKAMLVQNPRGDKTTVKHGDDSFPAVVRHTDSVAWIHYIGWSENTDEFIRRSELLERVPEDEHLLRLVGLLVPTGLKADAAEQERRQLVHAARALSRSCADCRLVHHGYGGCAQSWRTQHRPQYQRLRGSEQQQA